jgi:hypothetical protein
MREGKAKMQGMSPNLIWNVSGKKCSILNMGKEPIGFYGMMRYSKDTTS